MKFRTSTQKESRTELIFDLANALCIPVAIFFLHYVNFKIKHNKPFVKVVIKFNVSE